MAYSKGGIAKGKQKGGKFPATKIEGHPASSRNAVMNTPMKGLPMPGGKPFGGMSTMKRGGTGSKGIGSATPGPASGKATKVSGRSR